MNAEKIRRHAEEIRALIQIESEAEAAKRELARQRILEKIRAARAAVEELEEENK